MIELGGELKEVVIFTIQTSGLLCSERNWEFRKKMKTAEN